MMVTIWPLLPEKVHSSVSLWKSISAERFCPSKIGPPPRSSGFMGVGVMVGVAVGSGVCVGGGLTVMTGLFRSSLLVLSYMRSSY